MALRLLIQYSKHLKTYIPVIETGWDYLPTQSAKWSCHAGNIRNCPASDYAKIN